MQNFKLNDKFRDQLLESAAWSKIGIVLSEAKVAEEALEEERLEEGTKKGKKRKTARKAYEEELPAREDAGTEYDGDGEQLDEEAIHVCPLCTSQLDEAIDEERLVEHMDIVLGLVERLSSINEDEEDIDQVIEAALNDILLGDLEEEK